MTDEAAATAPLSTLSLYLLYHPSLFYTHTHACTHVFWLASIPRACTNPLMSNYKG